MENIFGSVFAPLIEEYDEFGNVDLLSREFDGQCYIKRVNKVLELYSGDKLDSFEVAFFLGREFTEDLDKWVRFAITKGVQKLDRRLLRGSSHDYYVFPHWILADLNASALKHLSLYRCVLKPPSDYFDRFIQLTTICLNDVEVNPDFLAHLLSACVLLQSFILSLCEVSSDLIIGPSLHLNDLKELWCRGLGRIEIDAVNLSSLEFDGYCTVISLMRTPKLVRFYFKGWREGPLPNVLTQLTSCPASEVLHLHIWFLENIPKAVPTFRNLKQLNLHHYTVKIELGSVLNLLKAAPLLEELITSTRGYELTER